MLLLPPSFFPLLWWPIVIMWLCVGRYCIYTDTHYCSVTLYGSFECFCTPYVVYTFDFRFILSATKLSICSIRFSWKRSVREVSSILKFRLRYKRKSIRIKCQYFVQNCIFVVKRALSSFRLILSVLRLSISTFVFAISIFNWKKKWQYWFRVPILKYG